MKEKEERIDMEKEVFESITNLEAINEVCNNMEKCILPQSIPTTLGVDVEDDNVAKNIYLEFEQTKRMVEFINKIRAVNLKVITLKKNLISFFRETETREIIVREKEKILNITPKEKQNKKILEEQEEEPLLKEDDRKKVDAIKELFGIEFITQLRKLKKEGKSISQCQNIWWLGKGLKWEKIIETADKELRLEAKKIINEI